MSHQHPHAQAISQTLIDTLKNPVLYDHPVSDFSLIETHISWILLTGSYAYKIKKPVNLGFLDFSTLDKRHFYCEEELRLNRRFTDDIYIDVIAIRNTVVEPQLRGTSEIIEYAIKMHQFPAHQLFSDYAANGKLDNAHIDALADIVADFHQHAAPMDKDDDFASHQQLQHWSSENFSTIESILPKDEISGNFDTLKTWCLISDKGRLERINQRRQDGFIRECHGDLHLGNIAIIDDKITLFDCIEFNPALRWIDVVSEIAFVAMDLQQHGFTALCWRFINRYLQNSGDYQGMQMFRYYFVYRAMVRAKVEALTAKQKDNQDFSTSQHYLQLASNWYKAPPPTLIITYGLSGSGKSTIASKLAGQLGAIHLRSDVERKRLAGLAANKQSRSATGKGIYSNDKSQQTYQRLFDLMQQVIQAGFSVIVDATFLQHSQRIVFQQFASKQQIAYKILHCEAPEQVLQARIQDRAKHEQDASEATLDVLQLQQQSMQALTPDELPHRVTPGSILTIT